MKMGGLLSSINSKYIVDNVKQFVGNKRKRNESESEEQLNKVIDLAMHTPKRKKLVTTAKYIYQTLYEEGKNSDLTVKVLEHEFQLHRIYLCQSPYFASMFGGAWLEYDKKYVAIDIIDPQITVESLKIVFGSLYNDEITLNPTQIVSILATATMFQLDGIIDKCREVMIETINPKSAINYYNAACQYADKKLRETCMQWFLVNLMTFYYYGSLCYLRTIPISLMAKLVADSNLFVVQTEFSLYVMLKFWMYMHVHPELTSDPSIKDINSFYSTRGDDNSFLLTKDGEDFILAFQGLRIHNLISHHTDVDAVQRDNIIPRSWLNPAVLKQWKIMLKVNQNEDKGPPTDIVDELFLSKSLRCGRILNEKDRHMWRWTGFHYGMDLLMVTDGSSLSIKRNHRPEFEQLLSFQTIRRLLIRVTVATLNEQRQILYQQTSGIKNVALSKTEEISLMDFDKDITFPLIISANILFTSPEDVVTQDSVTQITT
ncbi:hypothetical protein FQA39_LY12652 [Lamprigera yunnana]|nr:hypothetical protein FQA39_LY12652 [Lamprigera yunnana]